MRQPLAEILAAIFRPRKIDESQHPSAGFYCCGFLANATPKNCPRYRPKRYQVQLSRIILPQQNESKCRPPGRLLLLLRCTRLARLRDLTKVFQTRRPAEGRNALVKACRRRVQGEFINFVASSHGIYKEGLPSSQKTTLVGWRG